MCQRRQSIPIDWSLAFPPKYPSCSPLDRFGFYLNCCWCIPLRMATAFICFLTFIWGGLELRLAGKFLESAIEDKTVLYCAKMLYFTMGIGLLVAAGILFLGVIMQKYLYVNIYIWYVLIFGPLNILLFVIFTIMTVAKAGQLPRRQAFKIALFIVWYAMLFYFLLIVNSFKSNLW